MRIVLAGEDAAGVQVLRLLVDRGHDVVLVMSSRTSQVSTVTRAAQAFGIPVEPAELVSAGELGERLVGQSIDLFLNVHSLHLVAPQVISAARIGSFNLHPGPLPEYAGLNGPCWAISQGATRYGCTLHWMTAEVDAGEIAFATSMEISERDTGLTLFSRCIKHGVGLVEQLLDQIGQSPSTLPRIPQGKNGHRYPAGPPYDGFVRWDLRARQVESFVRACDFRPFSSPWGTPRTLLGVRELAIKRVSLTGAETHAVPGTVSRLPSGQTVVATADEWVAVEGVAVKGHSEVPDEMFPIGACLVGPTV